MFTLRAVRPLVRLEVRRGFGDALGSSRGADSAGHIPPPNRVAAPFGLKVVGRREHESVIRNPLKSFKSREENIIKNSSFIDYLEKASLKRDIKEVERLIHSLDLLEQLGLHGELNVETLKVIKDYRDQIHVSKHVKEHMIWYYFSQQEWTEEVLEEVSEIYEQEGFIAMESLVVSALKENQIEKQQIEKIKRVFDTKEVKKQINKWEERNIKK